jgi:hypothetical protein
MLLVSPDFIASEYCMEVEMQIAMEMHQKGLATVVPIILRASDWQDEPFGNFLALPTDGKPVTKWDDQDDAFLDIVRGVKDVVEKIRSQPDLQTRSS